MHVLLRRIIEHSKEQNWFAVALDLVVVVVGIFLAFQVDSWYEERKLQETVIGTLSGLAFDFESNREALLDTKNRHTRSLEAIEDILLYDPELRSEISHEEF